MPVVLVPTEELEALIERVVRRALGATARPAMPLEVLTSEQAAAFLGVAEKTVRRWARERRLQGRKRGRGWRFSRSEVEAFKAGGGEQMVKETLASLGKG